MAHLGYIYIFKKGDSKLIFYILQQKSRKCTVINLIKKLQSSYFDCLVLVLSSPAIYKRQLLTTNKCNFSDNALNILTAEYELTRSWRSINGCQIFTDLEGVSIESFDKK